MIQNSLAYVSHGCRHKRNIPEISCPGMHLPNCTTTFYQLTGTCIIQPVFTCQTYMHIYLHCLKLCNHVNINVLHDFFRIKVFWHDHMTLFRNLNRCRMINTGPFTSILDDRTSLWINGIMNHMYWSGRNQTLKYPGSNAIKHKVENTEISTHTTLSPDIGRVARQSCRPWLKRSRV